VTLTEALRAGAPEAFGALYDEQAGQLYAYCHLMVGDEAADAVCDTFVAIARHPDSVPADEDALPAWLHALARAVCVRRGALVRAPMTTPSSNPLWRTLAGLSPADREVLALATALVPEEIAWVLRVTRDTAETLVRASQRRLEHALSVANGQDVLAPLSEDTLRRLVTQMYEPAERERERVLSSCAAAEHEADETLAFDIDGRPVGLDAPSQSAGEPGGPSAEGSPEEPATGPSSRTVPTDPGPSSEDSRSGTETRPVDRAERAERRKQSFRPRRIEGLLQVAGLAALVLVAVGVMTLRADRSGGSPGEDGTDLTLHRKGTASPSARPAPPALPPQAVPTAPPSSPPPAGAPPSTAPVDPGARWLPPGGSDPAHPIPPPSYPAPPSDPRPPVHLPAPPVDRTPTPSVSPTGKDPKSPTPHPSDS
jgi:DNA-directed RNA polymerase specialized sigma24 family protein